MSKTVYTIGRDESCDIRLYDSKNILSRYHAVLKICGRDKYVIVDQSFNGTYINGVKIVPEKEVPVSRKDTVMFADGVVLDWSLIPDGGRKVRRVVAISAALAAALVVCLMWIFFGGREQISKEIQESGMVLSYPQSPVHNEHEVEDGELDFIRKLPEKETKNEAADSQSHDENDIQNPTEESVNIDAIY